jgi:hypothetical protein
MISSPSRSNIRAYHRRVRTAIPVIETSPPVTARASNAVRVSRARDHVLKLGFGYARILNSPLALNASKLRTGRDVARASCRSGSARRTDRVAQIIGSKSRIPRRRP